MRSVILLSISRFFLDETYQERGRKQTWMTGERMQQKMRERKKEKKREKKSREA
jgi:hypothetical protein